eukprot:724264-Amphidinium_carterae.1
MNRRGINEEGALERYDFEAKVSEQPLQGFLHPLGMNQLFGTSSPDASWCCISFSRRQLPEWREERLHVNHQSNDETDLTHQAEKYLACADGFGQNVPQQRVNLLRLL